MKKCLFNTHDDDEEWKTVDRYHYLNEPYKLPFEIPFTHLTHFTENVHAESIGRSNQDTFTFKPSNWGPFSKNHYFIWFAALPVNGWKDMLNGHYNIQTINPKFYESFGTSPAFNGESLCGPIGFVVSWKNLIEQYAKSKGKNLSQIRLRVFGTFVYRLEIMYSILVCSDDDIIHYEDEDETLKEFSLLRSDADTEAFRINGDDFIWKAYCTTNGWVSADILRKERPRGTWDHLAFSFFYTDKNQTLEIPPYMCRIKTKKATSFRPFSRQDNKSNRTFEEMVYDEQIVHMLYEKIDESVDEAARRKYGIGMD